MAHQCANFQTFDCWHKNQPNCQARSQISFKFYIAFQRDDPKFLCNFLTEILYALDKKSPSMAMYNFSDFSVL